MKAQLATPSPINVAKLVRKWRISQKSLNAGRIVPERFGKSPNPKIGYLIVVLGAMFLSGCGSNSSVQVPPAGQDQPPSLTMTIIVTTPAPASDVTVFTATRSKPTDPNNFAYDSPANSTIQLAFVANNDFTIPNSGTAMGGVKQ